MSGVCFLPALPPYPLPITSPPKYFTFNIDSFNILDLFAPSRFFIFFWSGNPFMVTGEGALALECAIRCWGGGGSVRDIRFPISPKMIRSNIHPSTHTHKHTHTVNRIKTPANQSAPAHQSGLRRLLLLHFLQPPSFFLSRSPCPDTTTTCINLLCVGGGHQKIPLLPLKKNISRSRRKTPTFARVLVSNDYLFCRG